jgi:hypothetical protein
MQNLGINNNNMTGLSYGMRTIWGEYDRRTVWGECIGEGGTKQRFMEGVNYV